MKKFDHPKEEMIQTFQSIWKYASEAERNYIREIWSSLIQPAHVVNWKPTAAPAEYQLELKETIVGIHPDIPLGELIIKEKMKIAFSEEKVESNHYRQIIHFPDKGILIRIGMGWLSKENPIQRIVIEENQLGHIQCHVEAFGQTIVRSAEDALSFWKKIEWQV